MGLWKQNMKFRDQIGKSIFTFLICPKVVVSPVWLDVALPAGLLLMPPVSLGIAHVYLVIYHSSPLTPLHSWQCVSLASSIIIFKETDRIQVKEKI